MRNLLESALLGLSDTVRRGVRQTSVVQSKNGSPEVVDDVDAATSAFYCRDNSFGRSRSSLTGAAASELTACASVQGESLSSPSSSLRDTTSLTQALLSRDAKTRILQEYEGLRGGFKRCGVDGQMDRRTG